MRFFTMVAWGGIMAVKVWSSHVEWVIHRTEIHVCRVLPAPAPPWEQKQPLWKGHSPPKPGEARAVCFLSQQLPRWCCQPRGELLGSCVWQSFLLEICSKCLPCPGHWQYSVTPGRNTHCHVPGGCSCLATYQDSAQTSCGKSPALSFPVCLLHILCTHFMWYNCTVCMRLPLTRQWPLKEPQSLVYCLIFSPQHSAWHIVTLNNSGS